MESSVTGLSEHIFTAKHFIIWKEISFRIKKGCKQPFFISKAGRPAPTIDSAECGKVQPQAATQSAKQIVGRTLEQAAVQACLPHGVRNIPDGDSPPVRPGFSCQLSLPAFSGSSTPLTASSCEGSVHPKRSDKRARYQIRSCSPSALPLPCGTPLSHMRPERRK